MNEAGFPRFLHPISLPDDPPPAQAKRRRGFGAGWQSLVEAPQYMRLLQLLSAHGGDILSDLYNEILSQASNKQRYNYCKKQFDVLHFILFRKRGASICRKHKKKPQ
jgi:hypothetical protein